MNNIEFEKRFRLSKDIYDIPLHELGSSLRYRKRHMAKPALAPGILVVHGLPRFYARR